MTDAGQQVMDRRAALAAMERGQMPPCAVCACPWRRHLGRSGVAGCQCGCPQYRVPPAEPELEPDPRLWTSAERREARQARRDQQAYEAIYGKEPD
jgi:hypothetical protein